MARTPYDPDPEWHETCAVTIRYQVKQSDKLKPLKTLEVPNCTREAPKHD